MTRMSNRSGSGGIRSPRRWQVAAVCLSMLMAALICAGAARAEPPVRVAVAGPMTGTSFSVGIQYKVGVTAALDTLTDGTILGRPVAVETYDDDCDPPTAEKLAIHITRDELPDVVIGHSCSGATIAAAPVYARHDVLQITPASTSPKVTEMGIDTIFRMIGRDDAQGALAAERLADRYGDKRLGILRYPGVYSTTLTTTALEGLRARGLEPVTVIEGQPSAQSYVPQIEALMEADVEVLYMVGGGLDGGVFMRQARMLQASFTVLSADTLVASAFVDAAGPAAEGVAFTFPPEAAQMPTSARAVEAIRGMGVQPVGYTLLAYAAAEAWLTAVRRAGSFEADAVAAALRADAIPTILGAVRFDAKGDIETPYPPFSWYTWKSGARVPLD